MNFAEYEVGASSQLEFDAMRIAIDAHRAFHEAASSSPTSVEMQSGERLCLGCSKGCSSCCSIKVTVNVSEVLLLVGYIRTLDAAYQAEVKDKIRIAFDATRGQSVDERSLTRVPCPFLGEDGGCCVYLARPLSCRSYVSYDRDACERFAENIPQDGGLFKLRDDILIQMASFERSLGLPIGSYELIHAMKIISDNPGDHISMIMSGSRVLDPSIAFI